MLKKWFAPLEETAPQGMPPRNGSPDFTEQSASAGPGAASSRDTSPAPIVPPIGMPVGRYSSFDQIYQNATNKLPRISYNILKVTEMVNSPHLSTLNAEAKRASLLMALEAAGVAVEDVLQDAVLRQKALIEYEEAQRSRLKSFEQSKADENARIQEELERLTKAHMARIQANLDEVAREQDNFRAWQKSKNQECERLTDAAGYCVPPGSPISANSLASVLERATLQ
jgi:hypothetical protein